MTTACWAQVLCIQGFLAARKHAEQILLLAEMMQVRPSLLFCVFFHCSPENPRPELERPVLSRRRKSHPAAA